MSEISAEKLAVCTQSWLDFQMLCGREMLLSEAYLAQPICEFLNHHSSDKIRVEQDHPSFVAPGRGRPKQVDYALLGRQTDRMTTVIEAKWVNDKAYLPQRLLDDVMRLECLRTNTTGNVHRYFLVAGTKVHMQSQFESLTIRDSGSHLFLAPILSMDIQNPSRNVYVKDCLKPWRKFYVDFEKEYVPLLKSGCGEVLPTWFKTTLLVDRIGEAARVMVWRVSSISNRPTFSTATEW